MTPVQDLAEAANTEFDIEPGFDNGPKTYWARELVGEVRLVMVP
jgi:hypothetical protein